MNLTDKWRVVARVLFVVAVLAALGGWAFFARDPAQLSAVIGWLTAAVASGEAAAVGKRATYRPDHHDNGGSGG